MKIGLDISGGDFAPDAIVHGAILAVSELSADDRILLIGDENNARNIISITGFDPELFEYSHTEEFIGMSEHPVKALTKKPDSSIGIGFRHLKEGSIQAFASAGNTGAMMVGAMYSVKTIDGVHRPAIASVLPKESGKYGLLLDVGANADCKPEILVQFAVMGSLYAQNVYGLSNPKVGLLNLGEEEEKGNLLTQQTFQLLKQTPNINFIGNIEGRDLFSDQADVVVCDGFTGNVVLKMAESFYVLTRKRGFRDPFFDMFNYEMHGGSPIVGVNAPVIIGHGISNAEAIKNMILFSKKVHESSISQKIKEALNG